jgi:hypothetical protein
MAAIETIFLLPYLAVKVPEIGIPKKEPIGRKNNSPPNAPSLKPNCILISGIRLAQLAKQMPVRKKKPDKTMRLVVGEIVLSVIRQRWGFSGNWAIFADLSYFNRFICIVHTIAAP